MVIPIYESPHKDEHILGWLMRLAGMNGMKMGGFLELYFPKIRWEHSADTVGNLWDNGFEDPLRLMRDNTLYCVLFPFLTEGEQAKTVERFLHGGNLHFYKTVTEMRFCPECLREDQEVGKEPYYRVWHQLKEIDVCARHGCRLVRIPAKKVGRLTEETIGNGRLCEGTEKELAGYVYQMYRNPVCTHVKAWRHKLPPKGVFSMNRKEMMLCGMEKGIKSLTGYRYVDRLTCESCGKSYVSHPFYGTISGICPSCREAYTDAELIQMMLKRKGNYVLEGSRVRHKDCGNLISGTYQEFIWSDRKCKCEYLTRLEDYKAEMDDDEFEVVGFQHDEKRKILFTYRHRACGGEFVLSKADYQNRHYCRCCESYEKKFALRFSAMVGEEYTLLESPQSSVHWFRAVHNTCGFPFRMRARNFLEGQRCPFCQRNYGYEMTLKLLEKHMNLTGYLVEDQRPDLLVTLPDKTRKRIRFAVAVQELTRLDSPEIFMRMSRMEPLISDKARVWLHIVEHADENGVFRYDKDHVKLGMASAAEFASSAHYLIKAGHLKRIKKGVYQIIERGEEDGTADLFSAV